MRPDAKRGAPLVPDTFAALPSRGPTWPDWLEGLPRLAEELLEDWELMRDGAAMHGECALVLPVRTTDGTEAALKLTWPHDEARHEHLVLQHWGGNGAVELLRADPHRWALLLERARPTDLRSVDDVEACELLGSLYARLHRPALPRLDRLSDTVGSWATRLAALPRDAPAPRRLIEQAASLARDLASDTVGTADTAHSPGPPGAAGHVVLHGDLHYENVLASARDDGPGWLVIDPKPVAGDPHAEPAPLLWNRWDEVVASGDVRWTVRRRLDAVVGSAGLDPDRARDWAIVRHMVNVLWCLEVPDRPGTVRTRLDDGDHAWITRMITIVKAVQD